MAFAQVQQLINRGMYLQAKAELDRQIHAGDLVPAELAEAYHLASVVHQRVRDWFAAARCGEMALNLAQQLGLRDLTAQARFDLGAVLTSLGDTPLAIEHLQAFLARAHDCTDGNRLVPKAHYNIALNLVRRRQYADAIGSYQAAATAFLERNEESDAADCWRDIAWCYIHLDRAPEALPYLNRLEQYVETHQEDAHIRNCLLVDKALYHRHLGEIATSMTLCRELFAEGRSGVLDSHRAEGAWVAGLNALDLRHLDEARMFAAISLDHAIKAEWPFMINQANALKRRVERAGSCSQL